MFNAHVPWPVHYTSYVVDATKIKFGKCLPPACNPHQYIQGTNGIIFGDNIWLGSGVKVISANHDIQNYKKHVFSEPIEIGNDVWIGANSVILPGVKIGSNVVIGAGSVVTKSIPENTIAVGNPCRVIKDKKPYERLGG